MKKRYNNPNRVYKHTGLKSGRDFNREKVRIRDNQTCQGCGKKWIEGSRKFDVHHLAGLCGKKSKGYDECSQLDILITLCHKCHYNQPEHKCKQEEWKPYGKKIKDKRLFCLKCEMRLDSKYHLENPC